MDVTTGVSHAQLLGTVEDIARMATEQWRRDQELEPYALTWPSEPIETSDGHLVFGSIICQLKTVPKNFWQDALRLMVTKTSAYGLALVERHGDELRVLFETHEGARAWVTPLHRRGDRLTPGQTVIRDDTECVGILWRPKRGSA